MHAGSSPTSIREFMLPHLMAAAKELIDEKGDTVEDLCLKQVGECISKLLHRRLWVMGMKDLAIKIHISGWLKGYVNGAIVGWASRWKQGKVADHKRN